MLVGAIGSQILALKENFWQMSRNLPRKRKQKHRRCDDAGKAGLNQHPAVLQSKNFAASKQEKSQPLKAKVYNEHLNKKQITDTSHMKSLMVNVLLRKNHLFWIWQRAGKHKPETTIRKHPECSFWKIWKKTWRGYSAKFYSAKKT